MLDSSTSTDGTDGRCSECFDVVKWQGWISTVTASCRRIAGETLNEPWRMRLAWKFAVCCQQDRVRKYKWVKSDENSDKSTRWSSWVDSSRNTWLCAAHHVPVIGQCRKVSFTAFDKSRPPFLPSRSRLDRLSSASTLRRRVLKDRRFHVVFRVLYISIQRWGKWIP